MTATPGTPANDRCTCMEVYGEDPDCQLHGIATKWALEHMLPSEWQNYAVEAAESNAELRTSLQATAEAVAFHLNTIALLRARVEVMRVSLDAIKAHATRLRAGTDDWFEMVEFQAFADQGLAALKDTTNTFDISRQEARMAAVGLKDSDNA